MFSNIRRITILLVLLGSGLFLLLASSNIGQESVVHQEAAQMLAPARVSDASSQVVDVSRVGARVVPVEVVLSQVPTGVRDPDNQLDRWRRGEIDLDENEGMRTRAELAAMREAARKLEPSDAVQTAVSGPALNAPTAGTGFDSIDYNDCCGGGGNVPPDPELAAGPNHVIAVVNVAFEIYDTNGNSLQPPTTFASFMSGNASCTGVFDPNAHYDEAADRFILGIDADGTHYCVAVSQTGDPTGAWNIYAFQTGSSQDFFDYPHAGVGNDAIYMGGNIFSCRGPFSCRFGEARIWAFDKAAMYAGAPAAFVTRSLGSNEDTPQPLNLHGWNQGTWPAGGPHYFLTETGYNGAHYSIFAWNDPFGSNTLTTVGTVDLVAATGVSAGMPVDVPQAGSSAKLQANDFRPQDFEYRNGYAWSVQTIACNPGGGTVDCIRWVQLDPATATVIDAGVYGSNGDYRFFGDLAVNHCNDMAVGYTKSGTSIYPGIWVTGRESGDPAGTLQAETQLKAGEISYTAFDGSPHRWGDYTEMTIGPDGETFWYLGQYSKITGNADGRWGTYIGSFSYANCSAGGDPNTTPTPEPTVEPTPDPTSEPTPDPTAEPTPEPGDNDIHVGDLDGATTNIGRNKWRAIVSVTVEDSNHNPVANATVDGSWSGGASGTGSCVTDANGRCDITSGNINNNQSSATFTVSSVSHGSLSYDAGANHDPDGDSNGTTIIISR